MVHRQADDLPGDLAEPVQEAGGVRVGRVAGLAGPPLLGGHRPLDTHHAIIDRGRFCSRDEGSVKQVAETDPGQGRRGELFLLGLGDGQPELFSLEEIGRLGKARDRIPNTDT